MGIGFLELVIIALAGLLVLGPQRIPELLRQIAKLYVHLRRTSNDLKSAFDHVVDEAEAQLKSSEFSKSISVADHLNSRPPQVTTEQGPEPAVSKAVPSPRADGAPSWDLPSEKSQKEKE